MSRSHPRELASERCSAAARKAQAMARAAGGSRPRRPARSLLGDSASRRAAVPGMPAVVSERPAGTVVIRRSRKSNSPASASSSARPEAKAAGASEIADRRADMRACRTNSMHMQSAPTAVERQVKKSGHRAPAKSDKRSARIGKALCSSLGSSRSRISGTVSETNNFKTALPACNRAGCMRSNTAPAQRKTLDGIRATRRAGPRSSARSVAKEERVHDGERGLLDDRGRQRLTAARYGYALGATFCSRNWPRATSLSSSGRLISTCQSCCDRP
jgi:hypothetical protein